jgi:hypothetical protein
LWIQERGFIRLWIVAVPLSTGPVKVDVRVVCYICIVIHLGCATFKLAMRMMCTQKSVRCAIPILGWNRGS